MHTCFTALAGLIVLTTPCLAVDLPRSQAPSQAPEIQAILKVGAEATNNASAVGAVAALSKASAESIPEMLTAMNSANELAANYLRSAIESVVDRTLAARSGLPLDAVRSFLLEVHNNPRARRLAYEIFAKVQPDEAARLLPGFANDPSVELRFDAVELMLRKAEGLRDAKDRSGALAAYQAALGSARDQKQIETIASELRTLGAVVDLPTHFGFLTHWKLIGPFDNSNLAGFETVFPPEKEFNATAEYAGKSGKVRWIETTTADDYGKLDLNGPLGELKEVTGYAVTEFNSPVEGPAELRLGCKNGWKVWLNGSFIFGRDEYHRGARIDQYRLPVVLKKGANSILLKVCQNADVKDWTKEWEFQLRVCDATGTAILATDRPPTPVAKSAVKSGASRK